MKEGIHPNYVETQFRCSCGANWATMSTLGGSQTVEICSNCHPFFTGQAQKMVDTTGRIEKFKRRYQQS